MPQGYERVKTEEDQEEVDGAAGESAQRIGLAVSAADHLEGLSEECKQEIIYIR